MTVTQVKEEYGTDADTLCRNLCGCCDANDWYCPSDCKSIEWIRRNYGTPLPIVVRWRIICAIVALW